MKSLTIVSHLTTSNLYVRKEIIEKNLLAIHQHIMYLGNLVGYSFTLAETQKLQRKHQKYLRHINALINQFEQGSFAFGG